MSGGLERANLKKDRVVGEGMGMFELKAQKKKKEAKEGDDDIEHAEVSADKTTPDSS